MSLLFKGIDRLEFDKEIITDLKKALELKVITEDYLRQMLDHGHITLKEYVNIIIGKE